jgi:hypothetical protein
MYGGFITGDPIATDFSDLTEQIEWARKHDSLARKMALEKRALAKAVFKERAVVEALSAALNRYNFLMRNCHN